MTDRVCWACSLGCTHRRTFAIAGAVAVAVAMVCWALLHGCTHQPTTFASDATVVVIAIAFATARKYPVAATGVSYTTVATTPSKTTGKVPCRFGG
jgi:hypothetical protein